MNFFRKITILIYMALMLFEGIGLIVIGLDIVSPEQIAEAMQRFNQTSSYQMGAVICGLIIILLGVIRPYGAFKKLKEDDKKGELSKYTKKEQTKLRKKIQTLSMALSGVENMEGKPDVIFVADICRDSIAVKEARRLKIPVVAIVDTNADPDMADYVIPANDDAIKSLSYILNL